MSLDLAESIWNEVCLKILGKLLRERWYFNHHIEAAWINQCLLGMERNPNCAPQLPCVYPVEVDPTLVTGDKQVVIAWVDLESSHFALINGELLDRGFNHPLASDLNRLEAYAIGGHCANDSERGLIRSRGKSRRVIVERRSVHEQRMLILNL